MKLALKWLILFITLQFLCPSSTALSFYHDHEADDNDDANADTLHITRSFNNKSSCDHSIDILVQFVNANSSETLQKNFFNFVLTLMTKTQCQISMYIISTRLDEEMAEKMFTEIQNEFRWINLPTRHYLDFSNITQKLYAVIKPMKDLFSSSSQSYYTQSLFFIPVALHRILPPNVTRLIMFDIDMQFREDIKELYKHFNLMNSSHIMGLANEQQPTYYHLTTEYREKNPGVSKSFTGFNSGTKLLDLTAIRKNKLYNGFLDDPERLLMLADSYYFRGHLGDQDFYSLLSFDNPELFYVLPCQWNRQLCRWWESAYKDIFDDFFQCKPPHFILHGNCGVLIPAE